MYGKGWKKIASLIKTRTVVQIRTHAQKYFLKLTKARQSGDANISVDGKASGTAGRKVSSSGNTCQMCFVMLYLDCTGVK